MIAQTHNVVSGENSMLRDPTFDAGLTERIVMRNYSSQSMNMNSLFPDAHHVTQLPHKHSWYQPCSATLAMIILLHAVYYYQLYKRKTKKQCLVSYHQLIQTRDYCRGVIAILSHPSSEEKHGIRWIASLDFLGLPVDDQFIQRIRAQLLPFTSGRWSGLPLLLYNSHLLWSCRALETTFSSPCHYARSMFAIAMFSMALELCVIKYLLDRSTFVLANDLQNRLDLSSPQADLSVNPIVRIHSLLLHHTMGTCTALSSALLFLHCLEHSRRAIPLLPLVSIQWYSWVSFIFCNVILGILSWRHHAVTSLLSGTLAGFLWVSGFHFLGELYWSIWWGVCIGIASLLSFKAHHYPSMPGVYVSWDTQGIIHVDGLPVITSLFYNENLHQHLVQVDEFESEDNSNEVHLRNEMEADDDDNDTINDLENPQIRGRVPLMTMDSDEDQQPLLSHEHGLTRRGGGRIS